MNEQTVNQFGCKKIAAERNQCCFPRFLCPRFSDGMIWYLNAPFDTSEQYVYG